MAKGTVYKQGNKWYGRVDLSPDPVTGKRRQKRFTAATKRQVEKQVAALITAVENGGFSEAEVTKLTISHYMERWLASIEGSVKPITKKRYGDIVRLHIEPTMGRTQLAKLSALNVQRLYSDKQADGLSPTTVNMIHAVLHRALAQAMRWGLLNRNVTELVDLPREATPEYITWNEAQVNTFLSTAQGDPLEAFWRLALLTGMRRGEMLGLRWDDIDMKRGTLSVQRTLSRDAGGAFSLGTPKSAHGKRSIALPKSLVEAFRKLRVQQTERRLATKGYQDHGFVFANEIGEPLHPNSVSYRFKKLVAEAGVPPLRIHDLRHTSATLMLANNIHPKIVQERLGHSNISMTLDRYSHVTMDMQRNAADQLDDLIGGVS
ncbi:MAG: tyrosine-type recombinase/integrase [Chloroflexota bacterium]